MKKMIYALCCMVVLFNTLSLAEPNNSSDLVDYIIIQDKDILYTNIIKDTNFIIMIDNQVNNVLVGNIDGAVELYLKEVNQTVVLYEGQEAFYDFTGDDLADLSIYIYKIYDSSLDVNFKVYNGKKSLGDLFAENKTMIVVMLLVVISIYIYLYQGKESKTKKKVKQLARMK